MTSRTQDSPFPEGAEVLVRYPDPATSSRLKGTRGDLLRTTDTPRDEWPWLPGVVEELTGPDEWLVVVLVREFAELEDGSAAPADAPEDEVFYPMCFRGASELKLRKAG